MTRRKPAGACLRLIISLLLLGSSGGELLAADPEFTICEGSYALCSAAPCTPTPLADENGLSIAPTDAVCDCVFAQGANVAPGSCADREAEVDQGRLVSTYSFGLMAIQPTMICDGGAYTDCFGYPCIVDNDDPTRASCTCAIIDNELDQPFATQGGQCDLDSCRETLWSAATVGADLAANKVLASSMGLSQPPSNWCSAVVETAAAENLCADYCYQVMGEPGVCTGEYQLYATLGQCLGTCGKFPQDGVAGAVSGNNVQCRIEHAKLAQGVEGPEKHCPHASPAGGGVCINRSPCQAYCLFYYDRVEEGDCPLLENLWGSDIGEMGENNVFHPNAECMQTCATFAGAGQAWEMSGDSANCRMQYYLMAHRTSDEIQLDSLCGNANPVSSAMCQGSTFGDYYKTRATDPCKELCYNDWLTCDSSYGSESQCMATCGGFPALGERQSLQGDTVQCRVSWAQYAFFVTGEQRQTFCEFAQAESPVCRQPGSEGGSMTLPAAVQKALTGH